MARRNFLEATGSEALAAGLEAGASLLLGWIAGMVSHLPMSFQLSSHHTCPVRLGLGVVAGLFPSGCPSWLAVESYSVNTCRASYYIAVCILCLQKVLLASATKKKEAIAGDTSLC